MLGSVFATARNSTGLDLELFARLVEIDTERLAAIEDGRSEPLPAEVDLCALVLGLRVRDLLAGAAPQAPMTLLLRSAYEEGRPSLDEMDATGAHKTLGGFLRVVRDVAELEQRMGKPPQAPLRLLGNPAAAGIFPAERDARRVRDQLGLGIEPIPSMRKLLTERLDVCLFFVTPDELDASIDGAATHTPRQAILVNASVSWWRTRMTLAHELAHLVFNEVREVLFSPHRAPKKRPHNQRWQLFAGFDDIEVRADAFAACFLAPQDGVRRLVGPVDPSSEAAIGRVGKHFGVGRTVAINRLQQVFNLSAEARAGMESHAKHPYDAEFVDDKIEDADTGLRSGALIPLVAAALRQGCIGKTRAWEYLDVPLTESIADLGEELGRPPQTPEKAIALKAQRQLAAKYAERNLHVVGVQRDGTSWRVQVGEGGIGEPHLHLVGELSLGEDGQLAAEAIISARPARE